VYLQGFPYCLIELSDEVVVFPRCSSDVKSIAELLGAA